MPSIAAFALASVAACGTAASHGTWHSDGAALIQTAAHAQQPQPQRGLGQGRQLVLLFDGTLQSYSGTIFDLTAHLIDDDVRQSVFYESGTSSLEGFGLRKHALRGYSFLMKKYAPGDRIFIFGQSRGCLEGRYLQSLLYRYGISKEWLEFQDEQVAEELLAGKDAWKGMDIWLLGCVEDVLRGVFDATMKLQPTEFLHPQLTPAVRHFLHAMALDETQDTLQVAELVTDPSTHQEQVWFPSDHLALCQGHGIVLGWLAERSQELGLLLEDGFLDSLDYSVANLGGRVPLRDVTVRNPSACRKEVYGGRPPLVHRSVQDRMAFVRGWEPYSSCCHSLNFVHWVSTPTYDRHRHGAVQPQWIKITFAYANVSPDRVVFGAVLSPHGMADAEGAVNLTTHVRREYGEVVVPYLRSNEEPYQVVVAEGPCSSILECGWNSMRRGGRDYRIVSSVKLGRGEELDEHDLGGLSLVSSEYIYDDASVGKRPRCTWLKNQLSASDDLCASSSPEYADTCEELRNQATTGRWEELPSQATAGSWEELRNGAAAGRQEELRNEATPGKWEELESQAAAGRREELRNEATPGMREDSGASMPSLLPLTLVVVLQALR